MNIWSNAVMTTAGLNLQAKLLTGSTLTITKAMTGAGTVPEDQLAEQTAVTTPKQTINIRSLAAPEAGTAALTCYLTNDKQNTSYTVTQVGVFAQDPDLGEILYFIVQAAEGEGLIVPSNSEMPGYTAEWTFYFAVGQASSVDVTVSPANTISQLQAEQMIDQAIDQAQINASQIADGTLPVERGGTGYGSVDTSPTPESGKMVTSGGVYAALNDINASQIADGTLPVERGGTGQTSVDSTPTSGSNRMVTSGGVFTALIGKQGKITYGTGAPSGGSNGDVYIQYA